MILFRRAFTWPILALFVFILPLLVFGQTESASLSGLITDQQGRVVPGVEVTATNTETSVPARGLTNGAGLYVITGLRPGHYRVTFEKEGFRRIDLVGITLNVQDVLSRNLQLEIGAAESSITVSAETENINTTDASVSTVVDRNFADSLPLNGRSFQALIDLSPGVTPATGTGVTTGNTLGQFTVNGQRTASNYWTVDGVSGNIGTTPWYSPLSGAAGGVGAFNVMGGTNSLVSVDALEEFRIQTSTYAPEFGRTPGGQISIATRVGTNQFHGAVFDYFRNAVLDATDWFAKHNGLPKAGEKQNDFGGVFGGPLIKDKTFFFFSYEGMRVRQPQTLLTTVPDMAARQAAIPAVKPFIHAYPLPNPGAADVAPGLAPFNAAFSNPSKVDAYSLRIDHRLSRSLNVFGRYNYSPSSASQRASAGNSANTVFTISSTTKTATIGATWTPSSTMVDEARFNYSTSGGQTASRMDGFGGGTAPPGNTLLPSPFTYNDATFILEPLFGTNMALSEGKNAENEQHQYNVVDTLSLQKGGHSLKFGVDYRRLSPFFNVHAYALVPYFGDITSFETGSPLFTIIGSNADVTFLFHNLGIFAQDTWRVTPRLTMTYGLRDDIDFRPTTENGTPLSAVRGFGQTNFSRLALAPAGTPVYGTRYGNVAPRIGLAYQLGKKQGSESVLRGGFGLFYDLSSTEVGGTNSYSGYPYTQNLYDFTAPFPTPPSAAAAPPILPPDGTQGTLFGFDPNLNQPYSLQWSIALEQSLSSAQTLTVSYLGSSGKRLLATEVVPNPNANYLLAALVSNAGSSNYNALQTQFKRQATKGLQILASYTWSHSIDMGSYGGYANGGYPNANFGNVKENRGDSDYDIRNSASAALTYNIPNLRVNAFTTALFGGWSVQNTVQVHSAPPVDILDEIFTYQSLLVNLRPDVVAGQPLYLYGSQYPGGRALNPKAFTNPPLDATSGQALHQGDLRRNSLRAFGLAQWDFAIHRDFPIREALRLQFRAEMFNVLNHPNFGPYNAGFNIGDPYFGQSTQTLAQYQQAGAAGDGGMNPLHALGGPRNIQLALRLTF